MVPPETSSRRSFRTQGTSIRVLGAIVLAAATLTVLSGSADHSVAQAAGVAPNSVAAFGVPALGDPSGSSLDRPVIAAAGTPDGDGYWLVASDGGIFAYGDAGFHGSTGGIPLAQPVVDAAADAATGGYWLVARDGGVFAFDATFAGSEGDQRLDAPIVGMAATRDGNGYWLVASDGGIFAFGDAGFAGSMGGQPLDAPIVGMVATADGGGYWLVARDGGMFAFGDATFFGSMGGQSLAAPIVGMAATPDGNGYWLVARDGGVFAFGSAPFLGSTLSSQEVPAVSIIAAGGGYRVAYGSTPSPFGLPVYAYLSGRAGNVTMAVYDNTTGLTWVLNPGQAQITASVVKVDIMADLLAAGQRSGGVPPTQAALLVPMIEMSDNNAASTLFGAVGGASGLQSFDDALGLGSTVVNVAWGLTRTTAGDQVRLVRYFAYPNLLLDDASRAYGLSLMHSVIPSQIWGVPADAPPGSVALKIGDLDGPNGPQVNSIGDVDGGGRDYVFAILSNENPNQSYGEGTLNTLATLVYDALGAD